MGAQDPGLYPLYRGGEAAGLEQIFEGLGQTFRPHPEALGVEGFVALKVPGQSGLQGQCHGDAVGDVVERAEGGDARTAISRED